MAGGRRRSHARARSCAGCCRVRCKRTVGDRPFLDWTDLEPFVGHVPTARLRFSHRKLANLHPAEIADLVEAASHDEGEEIIEAVGQDRELEADVFEELDEHHQLEFIRERPDAQVAAVIARMAADDAADLIVEIEQERRGHILALLPPAQRRQIEALLGYNPSTAGGLMSPDFIALAEEPTAARGARAGALERDRAGNAHHVYLRDAEGKLSGSVAVVTLLRAAAQTPLSSLAEHEPVSVHTDADLPEVARTMTDYNLVMLAGRRRGGAHGRRGHRRRRARADAAERLAAALRARARLTARCVRLPRASRR